MKLIYVSKIIESTLVSYYANSFVSGTFRLTLIKVLVFKTQKPCPLSDKDFVYYFMLNFHSLSRRGDEPWTPVAEWSATTLGDFESEEGTTHSSREDPYLFPYPST